MPDHYYTSQPQSAHKPGSASLEYRGHKLVFETDSGVFSRDGIDFGTELLLNALPDGLCGDVLDMGCGYGAIGVSVGKAYPAVRVVMSDVNERACGLARLNSASNGVGATVLEGDGYSALHDERFSYIIQNPPIRAGKAVIYAMFAEAARRLESGGELWLVIRKQQGAPSAVSYLKTLFASVVTANKKAGYWVLRCAEPIHNQTEEGNTH